MTKLVKCPACNGRGMIGTAVPVCPNGKGIMLVDFECDFCRGRGRVSKKRAEKYEQARAERKGTEKGMGAIFKVAK